MRTKINARKVETLQGIKIHSPSIYAITEVKATIKTIVFDTFTVALRCPEIFKKG